MKKIKDIIIKMIRMIWGLTKKIIGGIWNNREEIKDGIVKTYRYARDNKIKAVLIIIVAFGLLRIITPEISEVDRARNYMENGDYSYAIDYYEDALANYDEDTELSKKKIKAELDEAKEELEAKKLQEEKEELAGYLKKAKEFEEEEKFYGSGWGITSAKEAYNKLLDNWNEKINLGITKDEVKDKIKKYNVMETTDRFEEKLKKVDEYIKNKDYARAEDELNEILDNWDKNNLDADKEKIKSLRSKVVKLKATKKFRNKIKEANKDFSNDNYAYGIDELNEVLDNWKANNLDITKADIRNKRDKAVRIKATKELRAKIESAENSLSNGDYKKAESEFNKILNSWKNNNLDMTKADIRNKQERATKKLSSKMKDKRKKKRDKLGKEVEKYINFVELEKAKKKLEKLAAIPNTTDKWVYTHNKKRYENRREIADKIGVPKNSGWDGYPTAVKDYLEKRLKDPDSLELENRSYYNYVKDNGRYYWTVKVVYRAKNSFGGYVRSRKQFRIRNNRVVAVE